MCPLPPSSPCLKGTSIRIPPTPPCKIKFLAFNNEPPLQDIDLSHHRFTLNCSPTEDTIQYALVIVEAQVLDADNYIKVSTQ